MTETADGQSGALRAVDDLTWAAWTPDHVTARLHGIATTEDCPARWATAGGWALDLFLGRQTREHEDIEIVVLNDDVPSVLDAFHGPEWNWAVPVDGRLHPLDSAPYDRSHQTWLWSRAANAYVLDVFRDQHDGDTWICRRDTGITMPWREARLTSRTGTPYLVPEIVLLFKAKQTRPKDVADLKTVLPSLDDGRRRWLRAAIGRVQPEHEWLALI